jgi:WD40 repeat protein
VWDLETGRELCAFLGHAGAVNSLAFSPDGATVVSCCMFDRQFRKGKIRFWDPRTGEELPIELQTHPGPCGSVAFSPNGRRVVAASLNGFLVLIDPATGEEVLAFRAHGSEAMCAVFDCEGRRIVSGGHDTLLKLWESSVGEQ